MLENCVSLFRDLLWRHGDDGMGHLELPFLPGSPVKDDSLRTEIHLVGDFQEGLQTDTMGAVGVC